jgi:hypothetical protein
MIALPPLAGFKEAGPAAAAASADDSGNCATRKGHLPLCRLGFPVAALQGSFWPFTLHAFLNSS